MCISTLMHPAREASMAKAAKRERDERLQIMLDPSEMALIDDFRFQRRMPSRAAAVRELLKRGLAAEGFDLAPVGAKSSEYGVSGKTPDGHRSSARAVRNQQG
jgi:hypothetical protein